jgi:hypothetical protein
VAGTHPLPARLAAIRAGLSIALGGVTADGKNEIFLVEKFVKSVGLKATDRRLSFSYP